MRHPSINLSWVVDAATKHLRFWQSIHTSWGQITYPCLRALFSKVRISRESISISVSLQQVDLSSERQNLVLQLLVFLSMLGGDESECVYFLEYFFLQSLVLINFQLILIFPISYCQSHFLFWIFHYIKNISIDELASSTLGQRQSFEYIATWCDNSILFYFRDLTSLLEGSHCKNFVKVVSGLPFCHLTISM